jgi:hypothetical protein
MACLSSSSATLPTGVSGAAVTTFRLMTSATLRECDLMYSEARPFLGGDQVEPPGMTPLRSRFRTPHQIALADDADQLALRPRHRNAAHSVPEQHFGDFLHGGFQPDRYDVGSHDIGGFPDSSSAFLASRQRLSFRPALYALLCVGSRPGAGQSGRLKAGRR